MLLLLPILLWPLALLPISSCPTRMHACTYNGALNSFSTRTVLNHHSYMLTELTPTYIRVHTQAAAVIIAAPGTKIFLTIGISSGRIFGGFF